MTTTVEQLSPTRVKLTTTVTPEQLKPSITHAYEHIAGEVTIPGFRKGKVPPAIIDSRVGKATVLEHAINDALEPAYREAITETKVRPLGRPEADIASVPDAKTFEGDLVVTFEVDVRPQITVPDYDKLPITVEAAEVTDEDVEAELDRLRSRFGTLVTVDRPAKAGDFVQIDLSAKIGDETVDTAENISYEVGSGELIEGIDEAIDSLTAGETTTFTSKLLGGDHEGEDAEITVTINSVKERELPEADDDFAQISSEYDTIAELREGLKAEAARAKAFQQGNEARTKLVDTLLEKVEIPVPEAVIEDEIHRHLEAENRLEDEEHRAEVKEASEKALRTQILFDEIAEAEKVTVSQNELTSYLVQASQQYGMDPNEFVKILSDNGQIPQMVGEVARNKAIAIALGKATVTDTNGAPVDLSEFTAVQNDDDSDIILEASDETEATEEGVAETTETLEKLNADRGE
ncbi:trigger factor [Gryllotalpicola ginsengisoli]|uniref:trigger factor n=1 Tax=Gryllotalpicola ginsengisoli TaxID=444608 RepID=UPI0003B4AA47|nr:trigger factor [Gryllotalpicola ginsengisoli]